MPVVSSSQAILDYLQQRIPRYPFRKELDEEFVDELASDFSGVPILDEIKAFRWYYDNDPVGRVANVRVALRRWLENAPERRRRRTVHRTDRPISAQAPLQR